MPRYTILSVDQYDYGQRYSGVPTYFSVASKALLEMHRQVGDPVTKHRVMQKGLLIRHLVMPGLTKDSMAVLDWIKDNIPSALVNLMDQYRPAYRASEFAEINRRLTSSEYRQIAAYFSELGLHDGSAQ